MREEENKELPSVGKIMIRISLLSILVVVVRGGFNRKNIIFAILCIATIGSIYLATRYYKAKNKGLNKY